MHRAELVAVLLELLEQETGEQYEALGEQTDLRSELELDSVDMVSLVLHVENRLKINIESRELEPVATVGDLLDLLEAKIRERTEREAA